MSLILDAGEVAFANYTGTRVFSSNDVNFVISDYVPASFSIGSVNNSSGTTPYQTTITTNLGAVNSLATDVLGFYEIGGVIRQIGGTRIHYVKREFMDPTGVYRYYLTGSAYIADCVSFYFDISGGQLRANVQYDFPAGAQIPFTGTTVNVYAFVGIFN